MDGIEHTCRGSGKGEGKGVRFIRIDGKTPSCERQQLVNSFQVGPWGRLACPNWAQLPLRWRWRRCKHRADVPFCPSWYLPLLLCRAAGE